MKRRGELRRFAKLRQVKFLTDVFDRECHINGEYCGVLLKQKPAPREINDLGCVEADLDSSSTAILS
jgi:hypothetical protein